VVYAFAVSSLPRFEQTQLEWLQPTELHKGKRTNLATFGFLLGEKEFKMLSLLIEKEYKFGFVSLKSLSFGSQLDFK
jgi:hypothetical protein